MKVFLSIIALLCLGWMGCTKPGSAKKLLVLDTMKVVMWDMLKADEWHIRRIQKDSTLRAKKENIRLYEQVFAIHGITRDQFYNSFKYYESHPNECKVLFDSVEAFGTRERERVFKHTQTK